MLGNSLSDVSKPEFNFEPMFYKLFNALYVLRTINLDTKCLNKHKWDVMK